MKIKIGPCFFERNRQEMHVSKSTNTTTMHALRECMGYEKKVLCVVFELKLNAAINYKDLNQTSTDKICDSLMESIGSEIMEKIAEKENIAPEDPCCFRVALYITVNGKQMPFLTDFKTEEVVVEREPNTSPNVYSYDPTPATKDKLWRSTLDEDFIRNPERPEMPAEFANLFGNNVNVRYCDGSEEKEDRNTRTFIFGCMDPEDVQPYQDEINTFQSTLKNLKAQVRDEIQSALKKELNISCCAVM